MNAIKLILNFVQPKKEFFSTFVKFKGYISIREETKEIELQCI
jgi:hypothetical protein